MLTFERNPRYLVVLVLALCGCQSILPGYDPGPAERAADAANTITDDLTLTASEPASTPMRTTTAVAADPGTSGTIVAAVQDAALPAATTIYANPEAQYVICRDQRRALEEILQPIAARLMSQQISYSQVDANEWRDCSGNFLRLSSYLADECPELNGRLAATKGVPDYVPGDNNSARPATAVARTTRDIAKWYADNGSFIPIYYDHGRDEQAALVRHRNNIKPGTVLWFSREKPHPAAGMAPLFASHINHMGTVISVERGENGELLSYSMYHGQNSKKVGAVTHDHYWAWPAKFTNGGKQYPPLGYWDQYLVGLAPIAPMAPADQPIMLSSLEHR